MSSVAEVDFVAAMKTFKDVLGDNDLAKQVFADANALDRQNRHDHFEARLEYVKQVAQLSADAQKSTEEQGLQTLKWLFLLNAGAIALVLTFAGSKAPEVKALLTGALIKPIALFVIGCVFVVGAGAAGFFNFFHAMGFLPSAKALHQFVDPTKKAWPLARMQSEGETQDNFILRYVAKIDRTFRIGVVCAVFSGVAFCIGALWSVWIVLLHV
jgi:hypothetical protein